MLHRPPPAHAARERERLPPGTIVESWESSDYIRPINFFAGTDPTSVSHGVPELREERRGEREEATAAAPVFFFMRAHLTRLYRGMRLVTRPECDAAPSRSCVLRVTSILQRLDEEIAVARLIRLVPAAL